MRRRRRGRRASGALGTCRVSEVYSFSVRPHIDHFELRKQRPPRVCETVLSAQRLARHTDLACARAVARSAGDAQASRRVHAHRRAFVHRAAAAPSLPVSPASAAAAPRQGRFHPRRRRRAAQPRQGRRRAPPAAQQLGRSAGRCTAMQRRQRRRCMQPPALSSSARCCWMTCARRRLPALSRSRVLFSPVFFSRRRVG